MKHTPDGRRGRRMLAASVGVGFLVAALILLGSIILFSQKREVLWPPSTTAVYSTALLVVAILLSIILVVFMLLVIGLVAALQGRSSWRDFLRQVVAVVTVSVTLTASAGVALKVFYWPWACANAARTIAENSEKWRLLASAETLADCWKSDAEWEAGLGPAMPGAAEAAVAYAYAASGRKAYIHKMMRAADLLPEQRPDGAPPTLENDIASRADIHWLFESLTGVKALSNADIERFLAKSYESLTWDAEKRRYHTSTSPSS